MDDAILITELNDFIFCPASIYFHKLYGSTDKMLYQNADQINGTAAHFDVYEGVLHTAFYQRKSLTCDLVEPFRPIIDWRVRIGINLKQFKKDDFVLVNNQWQLEYRKSTEYASIFMKDLLDNKENIFLYIRSYYRSFMKGVDVDDFPKFNIFTDGVSISRFGN